MVSDSWRKNLYVIFIAHFVTQVAFSFVNPFLPLYIQSLGSFNEREAAFWGGIAVGGSGITQFISAPIWGMIADRWGRKLMVLRAMFAASVVLTLMGIAPNVYSLIALRLVQGLLTGTTSATTALVAASIPRNKIPFGMGLVLMASFGGTTIGPLIGGVLADNFGYEATFFITGFFLFSGGLIVLFFAREKFERNTRQTFSLRSLLRLAVSRGMLPLLIVLGALHAGPQLVSPIIPLLFKELNSGGNAATMSGLAFALMGAIAGISAFIVGRMGEQISLKKIIVFSCVATSLLYLPPIWAATSLQLLVLVGVIGLFKGGLMTPANAIVGFSVPVPQQGVAFGLAQSANALGNGLGPILGGGLASLFGLRSVFAVTSILFVLVSVLVTKLLVVKPLEKS